MMKKLSQIINVFYVTNFCPSVPYALLKQTALYVLVVNTII